MVPKILHFIFGMTEDFGNKPFNLVHNIAIKSARHYINPDKIFVYYKYDSNNEYWDDIKHLAEFVKIESPSKIFNRPIECCAHKTDVIRLTKLIEVGGIYLDFDTICLKSFDDLLDNKFVMGKQDEWGLCNAIMLSEKNSDFAKIWYDSYVSFDKSIWDYHSVVLPGLLSKKHPELITILKTESFFQPNPSNTDTIFDGYTDKSNDYAMHLWEGMCWDKYIKNINKEWIRNSNSTYASYAKKFI